MVKHQVKDEDGVPCYTSTRCPTDCLSTDEKTQTADAPSRATSGDRAPTAAADAPYNSSNLQAAVQHNADKENEKQIEATCGPG